MEYQALYRKHRPQRFGQIVGQDHVTRTLSREVLDGKVAHAYLFAGPRGTGKTTTARILAKALNCPDRGADAEPCNVCTSCIGITEGSSLDVIELDAASHNKVEDIREIRINVGTVAAAGNARRIYILDEAHMLSRAAGNALLKTLEEPPEHVIFVLATTEPYKLLDTIRSRSQRFDFHPVASDTLISYLGDIAGREGYEPEPEGLAMVATHAKGSVRDAMSLLEQVAALGAGKVEAATVARALGLADRDAYGRLAHAIVEEDAPAALGLVAQLASQGADLRRFVAEAVEFFRGIFLALYAPNLEEVADDPPEILDEWRRFAKIVPAADVLRTVDQLSEALAHLRQGREERLVVELTLLRLTRPEAAVDTASLNARLQRLEAQVKRIGSAPAVGAETPSAADTGRAPVAAPSPAASAEAAMDITEAPFAAATPEQEPAAPPVPAPQQGVAPVRDLGLPQVEAVWPAIVARVRDDAGPRRHALLREAGPVAVEGSTVVCEVPAHLPFHLEQLRADTELQHAVVTIATGMLGGSIELDFRPAPDDGGGAAPERPPPSRAPDKEELLEEGATATDPTELVVDILGGEVVTD